LVSRITYNRWGERVGARLLSNKRVYSLGRGGGKKGGEKNAHNGSPRGEQVWGRMQQGEKGGKKKVIFGKGGGGKKKKKKKGEMNLD